MPRAQTTLKYSEHDDGVLNHLYKDYRDDIQAKLVEDELISQLDGGSKVSTGAKWEDPDFPADATSLFKNPDQTPQSALPVDKIEWARISDRFPFTVGLPSLINCLCIG